MMTKKLLIFFILMTTARLEICTALTKYRTSTFDPNLRTLQVSVEGDSLTYPFLYLNNDSNYIEISFDYLGTNANSYYYKVIHCNADWTKSELSDAEVFNGVNNGMINDYEYSFNTIVNYIHYSFKLPNNNLSFNVSGNYAVLLAEDLSFEHPLAIACFSIVDARTSISGTVSGNTMRGINAKYQQLNFTVDDERLNPQNPMMEIFVTVAQNNRYDNRIYNIKPTYLNGSKLSYTNNPKLIFEGGNQYRTIDFSSQYSYGSNIKHISFDNGRYNVALEPILPRNNQTVDMSFDSDGQFVVHRQNNDNPNTEADYMWVHFVMPAKNPELGGSFYLMGDFVNNVIDTITRLDYDFKKAVYHKTLLLKQGGYNFMVGYLPKNETRLDLSSFEGSYWQTENEYIVLVYYRPLGGRYDRLVGYKKISRFDY